ncbi:hypothetical protein A2833_01480 [Candidatus Azambacteria bacterium RIFCSPHIGHO2_01_FULL_44_55]|uniref:T-box transcription factor-associated domain-containing protein n=1 Tax=Candidatus Azambacteria bacterium RIFCSPLOWO2_02_FULL_44_14 TaxID=1797306 RepID=A0A1F5CB05_9BACT|nr:MAG: hypothetical protein A3A18_01745 [Candidatus Azambacteria bacterium RIFCSPLOWO2_01_FULL_44_84]OGD33538.1 MAG: hypothetical protein A3C78_02370 [Candidatus Azambacteria bacterium RIFCSPHIGHO2_02_FULL_45_18]OGD40017.1 MAG: hypothetical protein A3I30_00190 [Candidatus Azambacteria bacterium RIFCSPLOWO2_02_FULL_44_14]OGD41648.1 MAG: hypothetical protein A2833_01480 [Candidatus Azambacteria bacterium RIFCSPHIGHO2_01_FULL_44_55]OGD49601.1 MAG: hypothetical protein A2608_03660 [Candidatus Azam
MRQIINNGQQAANPGFSLLETVIAMGIIMVGLASALVLMSSSTAAVATVRERLVAANLVQEGFEIVRNVRDNNWLQGLPFNNNLADGTNYDGEYSGATLINYGVSLPPALLFNAATGFYSHTGGGTATPYTRKITISNASPVEIKVEVSVTWTNRNKVLTVAAEDHLFNWK